MVVAATWSRAASLSRVALISAAKLVGPAHSPRDRSRSFPLRNVR